MDPSELSMNQRAILLALDKVPPTRSGERLYLEKLLFLIAKSDQDELRDLGDSFEPYKFGMYSEFADEILNGLEAIGLSEDSRILEPGRAVALKIRSDPESRELVETADAVARFAEGLETEDLVYLTYRLYPELTKKSEIAGRVESKTLEHFSIAIRDLQEDTPVTIQSDKGGRVVATRRGHTLELGL